jgi:hypothetical protein
VGTATFRVGAPTDRLAVVDWDCDGTATLVLLRPESGEVFGFEDWDPSGQGSPGVLLDRHTGAVDLVTDGRCGLSVRLDAGRTVEVAP